MLKSRKIRTRIADNHSVYMDPYVWFPTALNIENSSKPSFELKYNKNYASGRQRVFTVSSEFRDLDRAIKPDILHPCTTIPVVNMNTQDGTTICSKLLNETNKKYQHKKGKTRRHYYAVNNVQTMAADLNVPASEDAKVMKILSTPESTLRRMEFKDYYGTRVGRKNQQLKFIYNFDNWVTCRVVREEPDPDNLGQTIYYYNPREFQSLPMTPNIKTIWTQKSVFIPVRFGIDVRPLPESEALTPYGVNAFLNEQSNNFAQNINDPLRSLQQQAQQAQQPQQQPAAQPDDDNQPVVEHPSDTTVETVGNIVAVTVEQMRKFLEKKTGSNYQQRADNFLLDCRKYNWDYNTLVRFYGSNETYRRILETITQPEYRESDTKFWETVKKVHLKKGDDNYAFQPATTVETAVEPELPAEPPQNETASLDQQSPSVAATQPAEPAKPIFAEQPATQPVTQPATQPVTQPAESPYPKVIMPIDDGNEPAQQPIKSDPQYSRLQNIRKQKINELVELIESKTKFINRLTACMRSYSISGDTATIVDSILNNRDYEPEVLYRIYTADLRKNAAEYENDIDKIGELFGVILDLPE